VISFLLQLVLAVVPAVLAITLHEAAHGYAALWLGDDTARRAGRLSLNPLRHVDRFGTIVLPGFLLVTQLLTLHRVEFMFGWAKPVPVNPWQFANPRRGMMWVAMAGPAMNFFLAWLGALALHPFDTAGNGGAVSSVVQVLLFQFVLFNLVLGLFNLLPIPPLDGGRIIVGILPARLAQMWARMERVGIVIVLALVFLVPMLAREFGADFDPVRSLLGVVLPWALRLVYRLAFFGTDIGDDDFGA
jgi:Zn-dependent protease